LEQITLTGHYRSQSLELIDFSNKHFYNGKLRMLPHQERFAQSEPAIEYRKVEGVWENNTNMTEAGEVANLVRTLLENGTTNIGVITFNFKQQELIQNLLEETGVNLSPEFFVKNIENVQGDERDVIIFSIGYAPSPSGQMRAQFGTLNLEKGENRLNVAITRARQKIYVVSSILPAQLKVDDTKNIGPKLLQAYLHYAYNVSNGDFRASLPAKPFGASWYLKEKIRQLSDGKVELQSNLPFADLVLISPERNALILTDDNLFHQNLSAKEAFAYTPFLLKHKKWPFKRFYSRTFWKQHELFVEEFNKWV